MRSHRSTMLALPCVIGLFVNSSLRAEENWPDFRGPNADGYASAKNLPTEWSETKNVRWKTAIHDKGWSSPVIWGDQVWLTTGREDGKELFAVCIDRNTGKILHDIKLFEEEKPAFCHSYNSYATPSPVIEKGRVYVHFGSHGTACIDTNDGKILWKRTDLKCDHFRGPGSSPLLDGNLLFLTFDGADQQYVAALDTTTGKTVWRKDRDIRYKSTDGDIKKAYSTPTLFKANGRVELISPAAEATIAYDPKSGEELWKVYHGGMNEAVRPVVGKDLIFLTSGHTANMIAIKQGVSGLVPNDEVVWKLNKGVPSRPSILLIDGYLYMVSDKGFFSCVEAKTGKQVYNERLGGNFCASPLYADGKIYLFNEDGKGFVVTPGTTFKILATNELPVGCMASPAAVEDALFVRTKAAVYCIGK